MATSNSGRLRSFHSMPALIAATYEYLNNQNQNGRVFVWNAPVKRILSRLAECKESLEALH
jgi:hypothetical protein